MNKEYKNPTPTVDTIINFEDGIVLIKRKNEPIGWALPGGFVNEGEMVEVAAIREAYEETNLKIYLTDFLGVYSDPNRDPRQHNMSCVFLAIVEGFNPYLQAKDDAAETMILKVVRDCASGGFKFDKQFVDLEIVFDHRKILNDYIKYLNAGQKPNPFIKSLSKFNRVGK